MDLKTYSDNAIRTAPDLGLIPDYYHAVFGLGSEHGELMEIMADHLIGFPVDRSSVMLELGDMWWYVNLIVRRWRFAWDYLLDQVEQAIIPDTTPDTVQFSFCRLGQAIGDLQDYAKKSVLAAKPIERDKVALALVMIITHLQELAISYNLSKGEVLRANIVKLAKRYPDGTFDMVLSDNRDTVAELEAVRAAAHQ